MTTQGPVRGNECYQGAQSRNEEQERQSKRPGRGQRGPGRTQQRQRAARPPVWLGCRTRVGGSSAGWTSRSSALEPVSCWMILVLLPPLTQVSRGENGPGGGVGGGKPEPVNEDGQRRGEGGQRTAAARTASGNVASTCGTGEHPAGDCLTPGGRAWSQSLRGHLAVFRATPTPAQTTVLPPQLAGCRSPVQRLWYDPGGPRRELAMAATSLREDRELNT